LQLQGVVDSIYASLDRNIRLTDLATIAGLDTYHFCTLFKQSMGTSPYQYVLQQRIRRAKQLLKLNKEMAIADVALQCGFANQSHFTRRFRQQVGITPKAYREGRL
jgi:AraC family transcriptional regulator